MALTVPVDAAILLAQTMTRQRKLQYLLVSLFVISSVLALARLDNAAFWDDEAHISIVARNYLQSGRLSGWDGRNLIAYRNGAFLDPNLDTRNPPLDNLVAAASFKLFGSTTWAGRFPFVLCGLASLAIFGSVLWRKFGVQPVVAFAFGLLALSPVFLLNIRTVRYNALVLLFSVGAYYGYERYRTTKRPGNLVIVAVSGALLFFSNYMLFAAFMGALALLALVMHRNCFDRGDWTRAAITALATILLVLPYALIHRIWSYPRMTVEPSFERKMVLIWWNFRDLTLLTALPWPIMLGLIYYVLLRAHQARNRKPGETLPMADPLLTATKEWGFLCAAFLCLLSSISPQTVFVDSTGVADLRYVTPIVPFLFTLTGIAVALVARLSRPVALLLFGVLVSSNILTITSLQPQHEWLLPAYIKEISAPYPTSYDQTLNFLKTHAKQDDTVLAWPEYANLPIMFYAGDKYRISGLLDKKSPLDPKLVRSLRAPLYAEENFPRWFIAFGWYRYHKDKLRFFQRPHLVGGKRMVYPYKRVKVIDVFWNQTQRPEFPWHTFGPRTDFSRKNDAVYVYERGKLVPAPATVPARKFRASSPAPAPGAGRAIRQNG